MAWLALPLLTGLACLLTSPARADDKKADASGTWKWTFTTPNGQEIKSSMKLKHEGDKLSGVLIGRDGKEAKIEDAKVEGNNVSFQVTRERMGQKFTIKYSGKLSGDTITGKMEFNIMGEDRSIEWEAKREK
jgi:hypothetical protein